MIGFRDLASTARARRQSSLRRADASGHAAATAPRNGAHVASLSNCCSFCASSRLR